MPDSSLQRCNMSLYERIEQVSTSLLAGLIATIGGGILWLVRRVLTNQRQIELLQSEIRHRDSIRQIDRAAVQEIKEDVKAMRVEIKELFRRKE